MNCKTFFCLAPTMYRFVAIKNEEYYTLDIIHFYNITLLLITDVLRTFAPKNFPRTDFFKTLIAGRK